MTIPKRHQCMIYEGPPTVQLVRLIPLMLQKLKDHYRCLFLGSPSVVARMQFELSTIGVDVPEETRKGSLVLTSDQSHLSDGIFNPDMMLDMLAEEVERALVDGYKGLWATGDMTWEFGTEKNLSKLLKYECGLEKLFQTQPAISGICQYHRDTLPLYIMHDALLTHPSIFINHTLDRVNPYYVPPDSLLTALPDAAEPSVIEDMIQQLTHPERTI
jgi:hypothetical protein